MRVRAARALSGERDPRLYPRFIVPGQIAGNFQGTCRLLVESPHPHHGFARFDQDRGFTNSSWCMPAMLFIIAGSALWASRPPMKNWCGGFTPIAKAASAEELHQQEPSAGRVDRPEVHQLHDPLFGRGLRLAQPGGSSAAGGERAAARCGQMTDLTVVRVTMSARGRGAFMLEFNVAAQQARIRLNWLIISGCPIAAERLLLRENCCRFR